MVGGGSKRLWHCREHCNLDGASHLLVFSEAPPRREVGFFTLEFWLIHGYTVQG